MVMSFTYFPAVVPEETVGAVAGLTMPVGPAVVAALSQRMPLPMPSTPYTSPKRPWKNDSGRRLPAYTLASAAAPEPTAAFSVTVGDDVYPVPWLTTTTDSTRVPAMWQMAVAPFPPPPAKETVGAVV